jgi:hypothetical protein
MTCQALAEEAPLTAGIPTLARSPAALSVRLTGQVLPSGLARPE